MAVTAVGTPAALSGINLTTASPVTGIWGTGQNRTLNNLLVAVVAAVGSTSVTATAGTYGWTKQYEVFNSTTNAGEVAVSIWTATAQGSDAAPAFTSALTGTAAMSCTLYELSGADGTVIVNAHGTESSSGSGTGTAAIASTAVTTTGNVTQAGCFAIMVAARERAATTGTVAGSANWTLDGAGNSGASSVAKIGVQSYPNPPTGSTLAGTITYSSTSTTSYGAGLTVVFAPSSTSSNSINVTALQTGSSSNGMALRVVVLRGVAGLPLGNTATLDDTNNAALATSITTTVTGSYVFGAILQDFDNAWTAETGTTLLDSILDTVNTAGYATLQTTSATGATPGPTTVGSTTAVSGEVALAEILPIASGGTITQDSSSPQGVTTATGTSVTTVNFAPPPGSLLVAMVAAPSGADQNTVDVYTSDGAVFTAAAVANLAGNGYAGVFIYQVPGAFFPATSPIRARITRQQPLGTGTIRGRISSNKGAPVNKPTSGPAFVQKPFPAQGKHPLPPRGRISSNPGALPTPPIIVVQHASATAQYTSGTSATTTVSFPNNITPGNGVVACFTTATPNDTQSVTSVTTNGAAENWFQAAAVSAAANCPAAIWVDPDSPGGQNTVDINWSFGTTLSTSLSGAILVDIYEISGLANVSVLDKFSTNFDNTGGTSWTSNATGTTLQASEIWIGVAGFINFSAADTTETIQGSPTPWLNEPVLVTSTQNGGTGSANLYYSYQISGYRVTSSTGTAAYSGNSSDTSYSGVAVVTLRANISTPVSPRASRAIRAILPRPAPARGVYMGDRPRVIPDTSFGTGQIQWNAGGPVRNPTSGPVFLQRYSPARAPIPQNRAGGVWMGVSPNDTSFGTGRVQWNAGGPVRNPNPGPVFRQRVTPVRYVIPPPPPRRGRIGSSFGAPVQNPVHGPPVYPLEGPVQARFPQLHPRAGRVEFNSGAPVRNPAPGPVFAQKPFPVQARYPLPPRGRVYSSALQKIIPPSSGPVFIQADQAIRARLPQRRSCAGSASNPGPRRNLSRSRVYACRVRPGRCPQLAPRAADQHQPRCPAFHRARLLPGGAGTAGAAAQQPSSRQGSFNSGAPVRNPARGRFYPAVQPIRRTIPQIFSKGRVSSNRWRPGP